MNSCLIHGDCGLRRQDVSSKDSSYADLDMDVLLADWIDPPPRVLSRKLQTCIWTIRWRCGVIISMNIQRVAQKGKGKGNEEKSCM